MSASSSFLGTGWGFPPTFIPGCPGVRMVSDEQDICESLQILFHTALGERVMQPTYGADLLNQVFEPMNGAVLTYIEDVLRTAVIYHEPRIDLEFLRVTPEQLPGRLRIQLDLRVRTTNARFNVVFPFYLTEGAQTA